MSRQDQYSVTVAIDGTDLGVFDKLTGGAIDSEEIKYKPGAMAPQISLGGSISVSNVVVSRLYDLNRDHTQIDFLKLKVGKGNGTITKQPLDVNGSPFGKPIVYTGKLKMCTPPDADSESNNAALLELEFSSAGQVG